MDTFAFPHFLWTLIPAAALALMLLRWIPAKRERILSQLIRHETLREKLSTASSGDLRPAKALFFSFAIILCAIALSGPQWGLKTEMVPQLGGNLVIALDISDSMLAEDLKPNRLNRAKFELIDAYLKDKSAKPFRIGLVTFSGKAYLQCPLTLDVHALRYILETVTAGSLPYGGTNLGSALKVSQGMLKNAGGSKQILLVTDGEDTVGELPGASKDIAKSGIKVSALWLGSTAGEPIPMKDENGNFLGYKKDKSGNTVLSKAKGDALEAVVRSTGGKFIHLDAGLNAVDELGRLLERDAGKKGKEKQMILENRYQWPLSLGFLLLLVEFAIPERKVNKAKNAKEANNA